MKISRERFKELGLGVYVESCLDCEGIDIKNGKLFCSANDIFEMQNNLDFAPCLDEERLKFEMSEEEYDAYRHNRLEVF